MYPENNDVENSAGNIAREGNNTAVTNLACSDNNQDDAETVEEVGNIVSEDNEGAFARLFRAGFL